MKDEISKAPLMQLIEKTAMRSCGETAPSFLWLQKQTLKAREHHTRGFPNLFKLGTLKIKLYLHASPFIQVTFDNVL